MDASEPVFPIKVLFKEDGREWILDSHHELACNLEWFDSRDPEENAVVTDKNGKPVVLVIEKLKVKKCYLA